MDEFVDRYRDLRYVVCKLCGHHIYEGEKHEGYYGGVICDQCIERMNYDEYNEEEEEDEQGIRD